MFGEVLAGLRNGYQMEKRYIRKDGAIVNIHLSVTVIRDRHGRATRFIGQVEDVTEARAIEARIRTGAARLNLAVEAINGGFWHMDVATQVFETSKRLSRFTAGQDAPMGLQTYVEHIHPDDLAAADLSPLIEGRVDSLAAEYRLVNEAGERWVRCDRRLIRRADGTPEQIVGVVIDINAEREGRQGGGGGGRYRWPHRVAQPPRRDAAAGGAGARAGVRRAGDRPRPVQGSERPLGHQAGDKVLKACAERLRQELRTSDVIARLGGDEFLVVMPGATLATMGPAAHRVGAALSAPLRLGDNVIPTGGSVGSAWAPDVPADFTALIADADAALYRDKESRRERRRA
ncbi:diguanylate cyclase [Sphingomonas sp. MMS24-JH45]